MLKLRIFRTFTWELACSPMEVRYGGTNPTKLVSRDELQFYGQGPDGEIGWYPVEVVEDEKPKHPREIETEKERARISEGMKNIFFGAKKAHFPLGIQRHGEPSRCVCGGILLGGKCDNDTGDKVA